MDCPLICLLTTQTIYFVLYVLFFFFWSLSLTILQYFFQPSSQGSSVSLHHTYSNLLPMPLLSAKHRAAFWSAVLAQNNKVKTLVNDQELVLHMSVVHSPSNELQTIENRYLLSWFISLACASKSYMILYSLEFHFGKFSPLSVTMSALELESLLFQGWNHIFHSQFHQSVTQKWVRFCTHLCVKMLMSVIVAGLGLNCDSAP